MNPVEQRAVDSPDSVCKNPDSLTGATRWFFKERLRRALIKRWYTAIRLLTQEGLVPFSWAGAMVLLKPVKVLYEGLRYLRWRRSSSHGGFTAHVHGQTMYLHPDDPGISRELAIYRVHEPQVTRLVKAVLNEGMIVIDIGSNIGYYVLLESKQVGASGKIMAVEPAPSNVRLLKRNLEANDCTNVTIIECAIGAELGTAYLQMSEMSNRHSLFAPYGGAVTTAQVSLSTVDHIVDSYGLDSVDLIRMDVEGYEISVVKGMQRTLEELRPHLLMELHPHIVGTGPILHCLHGLRAMGYDTKYVIDNNRDQPWQSWCVRWETPGIDRLLKDQRLLIERRVVTVLLAHTA